MARAPGDVPFFSRGLPPGASAELSRLYDAAASEAGLLAVDFFTIRDLVEVSGYVEDEPLRALLLCLLVALNEGSLCVELAEDRLRARIRDLVPEEDADLWTGRILKARADAYPELIGRGADDNRPVVLHEQAGRRYVYFQKYLRHELIFHESLRGLLGATPAKVPSERWRQVLREVLKDQPLRMGTESVRLDRDQRLALGLALMRRFAVISGGPGTGKTSIVVTLLRCLVRSGVPAEAIALAAPTGRAAQRLTDSLQQGLGSLANCPDDSPDSSLKVMKGTTLHHLLGFRPSLGTFRRHAENPVPADVVIVDEASMVGVEMMSRLLQALKPGARLVLLGDKDQLPSVEAGAVLACLVAERDQGVYGTDTCRQLRALFPDLELLPTQGAGPLTEALVVLQRNYRSEKTIQDLAVRINRQDPNVLDGLPRWHWQRGKPAESLDDLVEQGGGRWLEASGQVHELRAVLDHWAECHYVAAGPSAYLELVHACGRLALDEEIGGTQQGPLDALFRALNSARLLTLIREGSWGCVGINDYLAEAVRPRLDPAGRERLFAGAPVLITRTDHERQLFNGDVGITLRTPAGGYRVAFPRGDSYTFIPADALPAQELGFALTVHKSQGSEYGQVLLIFPPTGGRRLLSKELVYTGLTRARDLAILYGPADVLQQAISRRIVRESGIMASGD